MQQLRQPCPASTSGRSPIVFTTLNSSSSSRRGAWPPAGRCHAFNQRRGAPQDQLKREQQYGQPGSYDYPPPPGAGYVPPQTNPGMPPPPPPNNSGGGGPDSGGLNGYTKALIAAAFVTGLGAGVYFDAEINLSPNQVASTEIIDRRTPNSEVCMAYGYSAMVFDQRVFVTYNPFNLYVTQPEVKPGCVLRRSNFAVLEKDELVTGKQVEACKKRMNTFGFVGDLSDNPEVSCIYHSEEAENQYLVDPAKALGASDNPAATGAAAKAAAAAAAAAGGGGAGPQ
jgi:hypothetical protein